MKDIKQRQPADKQTERQGDINGIIEDNIDKHECIFNTQIRIAYVLEN